MKSLLGRLSHFVFLSLFIVSCDKMGFIGIQKPDPTAPAPNNGTPTQAVRLDVTGADSLAAGNCGIYQIQTVDNAGLVSMIGVAANSSAAVSVSGSASLFSDALCTVPASSVALSGTGTGWVFVKDNLRENINLLASVTTATSPLSGSKAINVIGGMATALKIAATTNNATYSCVPATISAIDAFNNATTTHGNLTVTVNLTGLAQAAVFTDSVCASPLASTVSIPSGSDSKVVYVQSSAAGNATLTADSAGLTPDSKNLVFFDTATAPRLVVVGPAGNSVAGSCVALRVESRRADGSSLTAFPLAINTVVSAVTGTGISLYSEASCTNLLPVGALQIPSGASQAPFFLKTSQAPQVASISAASTGFVSVPGSVAIVPVAPTSVQFVGVPGSVQAGQCSSFQVGLFDGGGNPAYPSSATTINLSAGIGSLNLTQTDVFVGAGCPGSGASSVNVAVPACVTIGGCTNTVNVSFRPKLVGVAGLNASSTGLTPAFATVAVNTPSGTPVTLVLTKQFSEPAKAGSCLAIKAQTKDSFGNLMLVSPTDLSLTPTAASASGLGAFFSDANCNTSTGAVVIASGTSESIFYVKDIRAEDVIVTLASGALSGQTNFTLVANDPNKLVFLNVPASLAATKCSGAINVQQQDAFGNLTKAAVNFALSGTNAIAFYSDVNCSSAVTSGSIPANSSTSSALYFSSPNTGNANLVATASTPATLTNPANASVLMTTAPANHLAMGCSSSNYNQTACPAVAAGSCQPLTIANLDAANALFVPAGIPFTIAMTSNSANTQLFYSNSSCSTALPGNSITMTAGSNPVTIYVKNTIAQSFTAVATPSLGSAASLSLSTTAAAPGALAILPGVGPSTFLSDTCAGPFRVQVRDIYGNDTIVSSATGVQFTGSSINGGLVPVNEYFFSNNACSQNAVTIAANAGTADFYIKSALAGALNARASGVSLAFGERNFSVTQRANIAFFVGTTQISAINFNTVTVGSNSTQAIVMKNTSASEAANVSSLALPSSVITLQAGSSPSCTLSGSFSLAAGQSCNMVVRFAPVAAGAVSSSLTANYTSASNPGLALTSVLALTGTGAQGTFLALVQSPASVSFSNVAVGTQQTFAGSLQNPNPFAVTVNAFNAPASPFSVDLGAPCNGTFPISLPASGSCALTIRYNPVAAGTQASSFTFSYTNANTGQIVATTATQLTGTAITVSSSVTVSPSLYDFGGVTVGTNSGSVLLTVSNSGPNAVNGFALPASFANFSISLNTCSGATLAAGSSCFLSASFSPTAVGLVSISPTLSYNTVGGAQNLSASFTLRGTGVASSLLAPQLSLSSIAFGSQNVNTATDRVMTLRNPNLSNSISITGIVGPSAPFSIIASAPCSNSFPFTLAANTSCNLTVRFLPTSAVTSNSSVYYTSSTGNSNVTSLSGTGVGVSTTQLVINPNNHNFGNVNVGQSGSQTFTITNVGSQAADSITFSNYNLPFSISMGTCVGQLNAGSSCTFSAGFSPTAAASYYAYLRLSFRNVIAGNTTIVDSALILSGVGTQVANPANLTFDVGSINYGSVPIGGWLGRYVLVTNTGGRPATNVAFYGTAVNNTQGFYVGTVSCSSTIPAGSSCLLDTRFTPRYYGSVSAYFRLTYNSDSSSLATSNLTMSGFGY